jgi:acetyl-CoA carboxylase biotin carboxyl carrier protein
MTIEEIKELLTVFIQSGVAELEVQRGDNRLRLKRSSGIQQDVIVSPMPQQMMAAAPAAQITSPQAVHLPGPMSPGATHSGAQPKPAVDENTELVKSPIVGTFYESASPGSPPFVRVGDLVDVGTVLCIIESMKLMNEIESEVAGTVAARLVENGRPVEYGEALFAIRPR